MCTQMGMVQCAIQGDHLPVSQRVVAVPILPLAGTIICMLGSTRRPVRLLPNVHIVRGGLQLRGYAPHSVRCYAERERDVRLRSQTRRPKMFSPYDVAAFMRNVILAVGSVPVSHLCTWWTVLISCRTTR
jgi:hypothetical protein